MNQLTITKTDKGFEVVTDGGEPQAVGTIDEALTIGAEAFGGGQGQGAPEAIPAGPAGDAAPAPEMTPFDSAVPEAQPPDSDFEGMRPKRKPGWDRFMMGPEGK
jgi:hypothetical protein